MKKSIRDYFQDHKGLLGLVLKGYDLQAILDNCKALGGGGTIKNDSFPVL